MVVASFHLTRYRWPEALTELARTPGRRRELARTPGLRFVRRLGTGRGAGMGLGADLRRWATFAVWDDDAAVDRFLASSPAARAWAERGIETWTVHLAPLSSHGTWGGVDPFAGSTATAPGGGSGPAAVLTRATIPLRHWRAFYRAVPPVEGALRSAPGLLAVVGVGEAPAGLQATFSLWRSAADLEAFAYDPASPHAAALRHSRSEGWFAEELFARMRPYGWAGTWDGIDLLGPNGS